MSTQLHATSQAAAAPPRPRGDSRARVEPWQDPNAKPFIQIQNVTKQFGDVYAVDNVSLDIYQREFFALLGPVGLRQDHAAADAGRVRDADRRAGS